MAHCTSLKEIKNTVNKLLKIKKMGIGVSVLDSGPVFTWYWIHNKFPVTNTQHLLKSNRPRTNIDYH